MLLLLFLFPSSPSPKLNGCPCLAVRMMCVFGSGLVSLGIWLMKESTLQEKKDKVTKTLILQFFGKGDAGQSLGSWCSSAEQAYAACPEENVSSCLDEASRQC